MNIHEYQAKKLFKKFEVPVAAGIAAKHPSEFEPAIDTLPKGEYVIKAQIHAGGRGKGIFTDGFKGGVKVTSNKHEAIEIANRMLGNTLVTHQTGPAGKKVQTIYFCEANDIEKEYYIAILLDREKAKPVIIASTEGGVDIEEVAAKTPEKIVRVHVDPLLGIQPYQARKIAFALGFSGDLFKQAVKLVQNLYKLYWETDALLVEINPLIVTPDQKLIALDSKVSFDDNALYRHPDIVEFRDLNEEDPKEIEASRHSLSYIALDGDIACMVNGAGLAMATMDIIQYYGGSPANFLDVGGGANEDQVTAAFKIILSDENVKGILVNIFGGIMKCDIIAKGIINAAKSVQIGVPLVVRLEGTHVDEGKKLLQESGLKIQSADSLSDAAEKIVKLVQRRPS